jgi:hypothetical protein
MQLDRQVGSLVQSCSSPTNNRPYFDSESTAVGSVDEIGQLVVETMQEHLGMEPVDSMAKALPLWKRFYKQWSKQLLQV